MMFLITISSMVAREVNTAVRNSLEEDDFCVFINFRFESAKRTNVSDANCATAQSSQNALSSSDGINHRVFHCVVVRNLQQRRA